jgi:hypothetical protein
MLNTVNDNITNNTTDDITNNLMNSSTDSLLINTMENVNNEINKINKKKININSKINPETIISPDTFVNNEKRYYNFAIDFFKNKCLKEEIQLMCSIINKKDPISLSFIEWFVMKYSYFYNVSYDINNSYCNIKKFDINISYNANIDSYGKENFDPCRRKKKFYIELDGTTILTTIGQLIFFRWCFYHNIIDYIIKNLNDILCKKSNVVKYFNNLKNSNSSNTSTNSTVSITTSINTSDNNSFIKEI